MLGDGAMKSDVEKYAAKLDIANRVTFLSSRDDIPYVLSGTDVFILTSSYEGAPLTILEALACGIPVVASDVGAIREYIGDSCCLIRFASKKQEIETFAEAAIGLLNNPLIPNFDLDYFGMQRVIKDYREVFLDVCGNCNIES
jgi:glycosyltransferase involved in cell wall biosynthesis